MDPIQLKAQSQEANLRATVERIRLGGCVDKINITTMTVLVMLEYSVNLDKIRSYPFTEGTEGTVTLCDKCGFYNFLLLKVTTTPGKKWL
jgi:hypothetical protein